MGDQILVRYMLTLCLRHTRLPLVLFLCKCLILILLLILDLAQHEQPLQASSKPWATTTKVIMWVMLEDELDCYSYSYSYHYLSSGMESLMSSLPANSCFRYACLPREQSQHKLS